jgi:hypothetical protein
MVRKYRDTHPRPETSLPDYKAILERKLKEYPPITSYAVLNDGLFVEVRCCCGEEFEYLPDQVCCPRCGRFFIWDMADDLTMEVERLNKYAPNLLSRLGKFLWRHKRV